MLPAAPSTPSCSLARCAPAQVVAQYPMGYWPMGISPMSCTQIWYVEGFLGREPGDKSTHATCGSLHWVSSGSVQTSQPALHPWRRRRVSFPLEAEIHLGPCQGRCGAAHARLAV